MALTPGTRIGPHEVIGLLGSGGMGEVYRDVSVLLGSATGRREIDVVALNDAPPLLYHRVIAGGDRILSRDLRATTTREGRALSRYCDYLPQLRRIDAAVNARLAAGTFGR